MTRNFTVIAVLITALALGACGKKDAKSGGSDTKCKAAKDEAAMKWGETTKAWSRIHASWTDKTLLPKAEKALKEKIGAGEEGPAKVAKEMVTLKDFVKFKIDNAKQVVSLSQAAADAAKGSDLKTLRKAAKSARRAAADPSVTRSNKAAWFTLPVVADIDQAQDKALGLATEARDLTMTALKTCQK